MAAKPIPAKDQKLKTNLDSQYGKKAGTSIYYAMANKGELPDQIDAKKGGSKPKTPLKKPKGTK